jgi:fructan beta-fructosidase
MLYVAKTKTWSIDRSLSGKVNFDPAFAASPQQTQVDFDATSPIDFELYLDWSSMELFLNNGQYCFTNQLFPAKPYTKLSIYSTHQEITNFSIKAIKSCWTKPKE